MSLNVNRYPPQARGDAYLSQVNPVSNTLYTVLDTTANVRVLSMVASITWATTQPTNLTIVLTIDGVAYTFVFASPVSGTNYFASLAAQLNEAAQQLETTDRLNQRPFMIEGRAVKIQAKITWATTQPSPLVCRVKYAQY